MFFWMLEAAHKLLSEMLLVWERKKKLLVWEYHLLQVAVQKHSKDSVWRFLKVHKKDAGASEGTESLRFNTVVFSTVITTSLNSSTRGVLHIKTTHAPAQ